MADQRRQVPVRLPADLIDRLASRCDELGMVRNTAIQRALEAWLGDDGPTRMQVAQARYTPKAEQAPKPAAMPMPAVARLTMDDVRPPFTPRLKKK